MDNSSYSLRTALFCTGLIARLAGIPLHTEQLRHQFGVQAGDVTPIDLARIFRTLGFSVRIVRRKLIEFRFEYCPVVVALLDGGFAVVAKIDPVKETVLIQAEGGERARWQPMQNVQGVLSGTVLLLKKKDHLTDRPRSFGLGWFFTNAKKYRSVLRDCLLASLFVQFFALVSPLVFMLVIDKVLSSNSLSTLDVLVFALVVVSIFEIALQAIRSYLQSHTANRLDVMLGVQLFKHMMTLPLSYFESRLVGDTIARVRELDTVRRFITGSGIMVLLDLFFIVLFIAVMYLFSPFLCAIVIGFTPLLFAGSFLLTPLLRDRLEDTYLSGANNQSFLVETLTGIETVKAGAVELKLRAKWENRLTEHVKNGFRSGHLANLLNQVTAAASKVLTILLLYFGAKEVLHGRLTVGQLIAFNMISSRVVAPIIRLSRMWKEFQQVSVSVSRIADIFNCPAEPGFDPDRVSLPALRGQVVFDRVTFSYREAGLPVLSDVSFSVSAGEVIGIVGSTGSGKTTLVKLIQRLYTPQRGRVLIDGIDLATADVSWLRRQVGVVVQDGVLFNGSIRDNIVFASPDASIESVIEAATLAGAHRFVLDLPDGYDTQVGERGVHLSTGQRQRLAIARALVTNPRMLIFDEATSCLDYESELQFQKSLGQICAGRTVFIVAHRLSSVRHADRIITLENGRIIENDAPEKLLAAGGRFALMHQISGGEYVFR